LINKTKLNNAINYIAIIYAFLLPLSRAGIVLFSGILIILWIFEGNLKIKFQKILKCRFTLSIIVFILFSLLSLIWVEEQNLQEALKYIKKYWYLVVIFPLFTSLKPSYVSKILYAFLAGMTLSMILSWGIYFEWWQIKEVTPDSLSPFMWHVFYSIFLAFSALLSLNFAWHIKEKTLQILYIILFILFTSILFMGIGRTGQVIFVIGLFILLIENFDHKIKAAISALVISLVLLGTLYTFNNTFKQRINLVKSDFIQMIEKDQYCNSLGGRVFTWKITYEIVQAHPIIGLGIIDHLDYLKNAMHNDKEFSKCSLKDMISYFHGQYIEIISQTGILGLFLFLSIFYFFMRIKIKNSMLNNIKLLLGVTFLLVFLVDVPFRKQFALALFALISAIIIRQNSIEKDSI
jgi:O-antigen ligase